MVALPDYVLTGTSSLEDVIQTMYLELQWHVWFGPFGWFFGFSCTAIANMAFLKDQKKKKKCKHA